MACLLWQSLKYKYSESFSPTHPLMTSPNNPGTDIEWEPPSCMKSYITVVMLECTHWGLVWGTIIALCNKRFNRAIFTIFIK